MRKGTITARKIPKTFFLLYHMWPIMLLEHANHGSFLMAIQRDTSHHLDSCGLHSAIEILSTQQCLNATVTQCITLIIGLRRSTEYTMIRADVVGHSVGKAVLPTKLCYSSTTMYGHLLIFKIKNNNFIQK